MPFQRKGRPIYPASSAARSISAVAGAYALLGGLISFVGWAAGIYRFTDWNGNGITIKANAALLAMAAGVALLVKAYRPGSHRTVGILGLLTGAVGALTLFEHIAQVSLGIDTILFDEPAGTSGTVAPGRMGPPAATSFLLTGAALILMTRSSRGRTIAAGLGIVVATIGALSLTGYWYGAQVMYAVPRLTGIAVQTASMIAALGIGVVAAVPDRQPTLLLCEHTNAGVLARRLLPLVIGVPLVLGWLRVQGQQAGLYDTAFGTALRSTFEVAVLAGLLWWRLMVLREADRRRDEFLATLAHELRNPLAPIRSAAGVLLSKASSDPIVRWGAEMIDRQVRHMARLLEDLLDVSRISRNRLELRIERMELATAIHSALEACRPAIDAANHELVLVMPAEPIHVDGDPVRLAQVFSNLLNNAAKYTPAAGHIGLTVQRQGHEALISVKDDGIGIPPEMLPRLFEIFSQAKPALERSQGGLGIGLSLARGVVELHRGRIEARSGGAGHGSEFIVHLPLAAPVATPTDDASTAADAVSFPARLQRK